MSLASDAERPELREGITHWQHGQFFAYFPAISTFESMIAELYAASVSNPGFNERLPKNDWAAVS